MQGSIGLLPFSIGVVFGLDTMEPVTFLLHPGAAQPPHILFVVKFLLGWWVGKDMRISQLAAIYAPVVVVSAWNRHSVVSFCSCLCNFVERVILFGQEKKNPYR